MGGWKSGWMGNRCFCGGMKEFTEELMDAWVNVWMDERMDDILSLTTCSFSPSTLLSRHDSDQWNESPQVGGRGRQLLPARLPRSCSAVPCTRISLEYTQLCYTELHLQKMDKVCFRLWKLNQALETQITVDQTEVRNF